MPFDGSVHHYETTCEILRTNFEAFQERNETKIYTNKSSNGNIVFKHSDLKARWNHEKKETTIKDFIKQQIKRKKQFNAVLGGNERILFFMTPVWFPNRPEINKKSVEYPDKIINILRARFPKLAFKIFFVNWRIGYPTKTKKTKFCYFCHIPMPRENYNPNITQKDYLTQEGEQWEKEILEHMMNATL